MLSDKVKLTLFILWTSAAIGKTLSQSCSYVTDSKEWSVTGVCSVIAQAKVTWCQMKEALQPLREVTGDLSSVELSNSGDYSLNCSARMELPSSNGLYNYEVRFGEVLPAWRHAFSVKIDDPVQPIMKNCPEHVTEGENVTCECSSERDGEPRPVLSWPGHTESSILRLYEVRTNMTHTCEMSWGKKRATALYTFTVSSNIVTHTNNNEVLIPIIGVAAVLITIVVTTCIIISTIRRKRAVSKNRALNFRPNDFEIIENSYYGVLQLGGEREFTTAGNDYVEVIESARNERETIQPVLYSPVDTHEGRLIAQDEVYAAVLKLKQ